MPRDISKLTGSRNRGASKRDTSSLTGSRSRDKYQPEPDPLADIAYTDDLAEDTALELDALQQGYRDRAKNEQNRFKRATDTEYWFAVCFQTREEKEAFLRAARLTHLGDKYLDGRAVANELGVSVSKHMTE